MLLYFITFFALFLPFPLLGAAALAPEPEWLDLRSYSIDSKDRKATIFLKIPYLEKVYYLRLFPLAESRLSHQLLYIEEMLELSSKKELDESERNVDFKYRFQLAGNRANLWIDPSQSARTKKKSLWSFASTKPATEGSWIEDTKVGDVGRLHYRSDITSIPIGILFWERTQSDGKKKWRLLPRAQVLLSSNKGLSSCEGTIVCDTCKIAFILSKVFEKKKRF